MEHLLTVAITGAGTRRIAIPKGGVITGVYSNVPVTIAYDDNGTVGTLMYNVATWEPRIPFAPAPIAYLEIITTGAASVAIRYKV